MNDFKSASSPHVATRLKSFLPAAQRGWPEEGVHVFKLKVGPEHIDALQHVNNVVWVQLVQDVALDHSASVGWDIPAYIRAQLAFVIRRHEIDYLRPAFEGDDLVARTWIESMETSSCLRKVVFYRGETDTRPLVVATTIWVLLGADGRPCTIPEELRQAFAVARWAEGAAPSSSEEA